MESNKDEKIACEKGAEGQLFILLTQCNVSLVWRDEKRWTYRRHPN
jgi:hypothetical protein